MDWSEIIREFGSLGLVALLIIRFMDHLKKEREKDSKEKEVAAEIAKEEKEITRVYIEKLVEDKDGMTEKFIDMNTNMVKAMETNNIVMERCTGHKGTG